MLKIIRIFLAIATLLVSLYSYAASSTDLFKYPFYFGLQGGYGSTTWGHLVPNDPTITMTLATPTSVSEGKGGAWGVFGGYEFIPEFALEGSYMHFQAARLYFDSMSIFTYNYNGITELTTRTETASLMGKFMLFIPHTTVRAFSSAGIATVHRYDVVKNIWRLSPSFSAGFNYNITDHWMTEISGNYTAGYGESEMDPAKDYVPFVYSVVLRLAYRI